MKHRISAIALTFLMLVSMLTACGNFQSPSTSEPALDRPEGSMQVIIQGSSGDIIHSVVIPSDISTVPTVTPTTPSSITTAPTQAPSTPSASSSQVSTPSSSASTKPSTGSFQDPHTCNHSFQQISFEDSTCAKDGKKVSYCAKCDTTQTESIPMKSEHSGGTATCQERAVCAVCGKTYGGFASHNWSPATCQSPATCGSCGITNGGTVDHHCENPPYNCTIPTLCDTCGTVIVAAKDHYFLTYCNDNAWCRDCGTRSDTIGPVGHSYSNGECIRCGEKDPDYSGGGSGSDNSDVKIKYTMTSFPVSISHGSVTNCTHEVSGSTLILHVTMKRSGFSGSYPLTAYYRVTNGSFKVVAKDSFTTSSSLSPDSTTTVTVTIPGIITSSGGPYEVFISGYPIEW